MRVSIVDLYELMLSIGAIGTMVGYVYFMAMEFSVSVTRDMLLFIAGSSVLFIGALWVSQKPKSWIIRAKVITYGTVAGLVISVGLLVWGGWFPPIP